MKSSTSSFSQFSPNSSVAETSSSVLTNSSVVIGSLILGYLHVDAVEITSLSGMLSSGYCSSVSSLGKSAKITQSLFVDILD